MPKNPVFGIYPWHFSLFKFICSNGSSCAHLFTYLLFTYWWYLVCWMFKHVFKMHIKMSFFFGVMSFLLLVVFQ